MTPVTLGHVPARASSACWRTHAGSPPPHPTVCCEPDSAGSLYMDPEEMKVGGREGKRMSEREHTKKGSDGRLEILDEGMRKNGGQETWRERKSGRAG